MELVRLACAASQAAIPAAMKQLIVVAMNQGRHCARAAGTYVVAWHHCCTGLAWMCALHGLCLTRILFVYAILYTIGCMRAFALHCTCTIAIYLVQYLCYTFILPIMPCRRRRQDSCGIQPCLRLHLYALLRCAPSCTYALFLDKASNPGALLGSQGECIPSMPSCRCMTM